MLKLRNVTKSYKFGDNRTRVLDNINIDFKKGELVFVLGKSGSGKSTLLNVIATLTDVDSGNIFLDDLDITKFSSSKLCNYRNNMIGYIYQDYHLIEYMSLIDNIKLGCTISNSKNDINDILKKLNIYDKRNKLINRLSGGEKQRVAIARALINNPEIVLCDEPTGALDSYNARIIMNILRDVAKDKLVIVVSHDEDLALEYADRIIRINDGRVLYEQVDDDGNKFVGIRKNKIHFMSILKLAIQNLKLKKGRTLFTSIALSLGFLCLLLVLNLSNSFNKVIEDTENSVVSIIPISVSNMDYEITNKEVRKSDNKIIYKDKLSYVHRNRINDNYIKYLNNINEIKYMSYDYDVSFPLISDNYYYLDNGYMKMVPDKYFINNNYEILSGNNIESVYDILLKVDSNNNVDSEILDIFNIDGDISYDELIGKQIRVITNDLYYVKNGDYYYINDDNIWMYDNSDITLTIVGIVREVEIVNDNSYFYYHNDLIKRILDTNKTSKIVLEQIDCDRLLINGFNDKKMLLSYLGYETLPNNIYIYVDNLLDKERVLNKLDEYNNQYDDIIYVDNISDTINIIQDMINIISVILIIFSLISIMISSLMIFILTNNRVVECVREIGIIRCLGARKCDVRRLFNLENIIMSFISSLIGIILIYLLRVPINYFLGMVLGDNNVFNIEFSLLFLCVVFNILIVIIFGYIPVRRASNKKIIDCIYNRC